MPFPSPIRGFLTAFCASLALASCADPDPLYVDQAWIRLSAQPANPSSGYFVIHGGPEAVTLRSVTTEGAQRVEMHESMMAEGGVMSMKPVDSIAVPAGGKVAFAPGGKHLMIWAINPAIVKAGKLPMTFFFSNGDRLIVEAVIRQPGDAAPSTEER